MIECGAFIADKTNLVRIQTRLQAETDSLVYQCASGSLTVLASETIDVRHCLFESEKIHTLMLFRTFVNTLSWR